MGKQLLKTVSIYVKYAELTKSVKFYQSLRAEAREICFHSFLCVMSNLITFYHQISCVCVCVLSKNLIFC